MTPEAWATWFASVTALLIAVSSGIVQFCFRRGEVERDRKAVLVALQHTYLIIETFRDHLNSEQLYRARLVGMAEALGAAANHTLTRQITDPRLLSAAIDALQFSVLMQRHIEAIPPLSPYVVGSDLKSVFEPFEEDFAETRELIWPRGVPDRPTA